MSDVYVLGVDMIKFGRFPDRTVPDLGAEAALLALDDAGLNIGNMEAFYCGNLCLLYTSPSPRDAHESRMPSSA